VIDFSLSMQGIFVSLSIALLGIFVSLSIALLEIFVSHHIAWNYFSVCIPRYFCVGILLLGIFLSRVAIDLLINAIAVFISFVITFRVIRTVLSLFNFVMPFFRRLYAGARFMRGVRPHPHF